MRMTAANDSNVLDFEVILLWFIINLIGLLLELVFGGSFLEIRGGTFIDLLIWNV